MLIISTTSILYYTRNHFSIYLKLIKSSKKGTPTNQIQGYRTHTFNPTNQKSYLLVGQDLANMHSKTDTIYCCIKGLNLIHTTRKIRGLNVWIHAIKSKFNCLLVIFTLQTETLSAGLKSTCFQFNLFHPLEEEDKHQFSLAPKH